MIEPGLARIGRLIADSTFSWRAIHVAGTNGKGSVCAYASLMLHASGVKCGRFTSPHLVDRWDCISVNENTIDESLFRRAEQRVHAKNRHDNIKASEFELLTATAFEVFAQERVAIAVIETGMGGLEDATNVLVNPLVTVITKIGQDHEHYLGDSIEAIATHKAGILKREVPCVVDGTNLSQVLAVITDYGAQIKSGHVIRIPQDVEEDEDQVWSVLDRAQFEQHQRVNISLAYAAVKQSLAGINAPFNPVHAITGVPDLVWPGRLHHLNIKILTGREEDILVDGAHNTQSAQVLGSFVNTKLRCKNNPVTWMLAVSEGKNVKNILGSLLKSSDNVVTVEFGPVDGMPWAKALVAEELLQVAKSTTELNASWSASGRVSEALKWAAKVSKGGPMVIAGSLYLVSDVLRLLRNAPDP